MTYVTPEEKDAMARLLAMMNGETPAPLASDGKKQTVMEADEVGGPGVVTQREINAMADVLGKLNMVTQQVMMESDGHAETRMAMQTKRTDDGVAVGAYKIEVHLSEQRAAGKQYYSLRHTGTNTVIANDITLYEVALSVVKMLNNHAYINDKNIRKLFELDDRYTSCKIDAMAAKRYQVKAERARDSVKEDIYATKFQKALDQAGVIKREIKTVLENASKNNR